jgi:hypothetical protein
MIDLTHGSQLQQPASILSLKIQAGGGIRFPALLRYLEQQSPEIIVFPNGKLTAQ